MREERKVVTALFADLVGSTALAESVDAEVGRLVVADAVARIVHLVEQFGGTVKDLAGDGVLALFGAPLAHEDDAERAVRSGLAIAHEIDAYSEEVRRGWGIAGFGVRIGIATGPVVLGAVGAGKRVEYGAYGDTVNIAARLQSAAAPGAVLVSAATRDLVETIFDWDAPGDLELKGKNAPVSASRVAGGAAGARDGGRHGPLVGRERELTLAQAVLDAVSAGTGGVLFVTGEAGIGKSRLVAELQARASHQPTDTPPPLWLEGRCVSYGESMPFWPFRDLLRGWLGVSIDEPELRVRIALRRALDSVSPESSAERYPYLGSVLGLTLEPDAAARLAELSPEALQYRSFEVMGELIAGLGLDRPVIVALEDMHWADATSIELATRLLALPEHAAVLLVFTQRLERDHPCWRLRETAGREHPHRVTELALEPLSGHADGELLAGLIGGALPDGLAQRVLEAAEGNPFYLEELVRSLADAGALRAAGDTWVFDHDAEVALPATVEQVILARIDRLPDADHDVLLAAAVVGRHFGLPLLEGVCDAGADVRSSLLELQRLDLVREERRWPQPEYRFKHALIQDGAYRTILGSSRHSLHRRAAEWLESRHADAPHEVYGLLAHHWLAADDGDKAIRYLTLAGDRAREEWSLDEAIEHYRGLLPLLEERDERAQASEVLFKLALALQTSMRFAEANTVYGRAFDQWQPARSVHPATATVRVATSYVPRVPDPARAGWWPDIQLCMQLFDRLVEARPGRSIVPSLAERWELSDDGLRYRFTLRAGLRWSDGEPLTASDVEYGIRRVLDPGQPGASVAVYFVLENAQDYYLGHERDAGRVGVHAIDERTVEFRLAAPAPYFMSVMNRPDGGPQPQHAIESDGDDWTDPARQVVSGSFRQTERTLERLVIERRADHASGAGNVARVEFVRADVAEGLHAYSRGEVDMVRVIYSPRVADHLPASDQTAQPGPAAWTAYVGFNHAHPVVSRIDARRALALSIDRDALAAALPANLPVATGGIVPPALQGHTPDIAPRFEPDRARELWAAAGLTPGTRLGLAAQDVWGPMLDVLLGGWRDVLGLEVDVHPWRAADVPTLGRPWDIAPLYLAGWLPGYPDPEYCLRLLLQSTAKTNEGGYSDAAYDELIERARQQRNGADRLELFHQADRIAVVDQAALIPLCYGRNMAFVKEHVQGWWEFAKSSAALRDLVVDQAPARRAR
jgi:ABC-type oligopeptide transport system substrate-binding subunit/class 3 adenylate cyclase